MDMKSQVATIYIYIDWKERVNWILVVRKIEVAAVNRKNVPHHVNI